MKKTTTTRLWMLGASAALMIGCGGGSKGGTTDLGGVAPPPKVGEGGGKKIDRKVSREAKKDFAAAVAFYQKQAKGGINKSNCTGIASRFEDVASDHPKLVEARFNAGVAYQGCGMNKKAESAYKSALQVLPTHANSLANLGKIYWDRGNRNAAKSYWESAVKADSKLAAPRNNLAWLLIEKIRARPEGAPFDALEEQALRQLQTALAVENDNAESYVLLALLYMEGAKKNKSRLTLARLLLNKAEESRASFAPLWNARGLLDMERENPAEALIKFKKALQIDPTFAEAHLNAGNIVLDFRKYDEAAAHFDAVLKRKRKSFDAAIGLGLAKRGLKDFPGAEASYKSAGKLDPKRAEAEFNLGILYMNFISSQEEDSTKAKKHLRTAIGHFRKAVNKPAGSASIKKEANDNVALCEKGIKQIDDFLKADREFKAEEAKMKAEEARMKAEEKKNPPKAGQ